MVFISMPLDMATLLILESLQPSGRAHALLKLLGALSLGF
jgi:hypothetical protein